MVIKEAWEYKFENITCFERLFFIMNFEELSITEMQIFKRFKYTLPFN